MSVPNITADVLKPSIGGGISASSLVTPINPSSISIDTSSILDGFKNAASGINLGNLAAGAAASIGGGLANKYISDGMDTGAGNVLSTAGQLASFIPGPLGWGLSFGLQTLGGLANRAFGYKLNKGNIANVESNINDLTTFRSDASNYDALTSTINNAPVGMTFKNSYIGKDGWARDKVKNMAEDYRNQINKGENFVQNSIYNNADNIGINQMQNLLSNYAAFGGPLLYSKGGSIHIKPENRGKFTETKRRTGKTTEELTHSSNPLTRKRAIFAQNAKKWHHAFGGELNTNGGDFTNGLLHINNGESHETNPYEGVQLGVDPEGTPNLVEEGETIFNDYVFSNRLKVPKAIRSKYKVRGTKDISFADMSKKLAKESEERPNDPISLRGLNAIMGDLANAQEGVRMKNNKDNKFSYGGLMGNIYEGNGPGTQVLNYNNTTPGLYFGLSRNEFNPYNADGTINWDIMYSKDSPYMKRRQYVLDNWDTSTVQDWLGRYAEGINNYNKTRDGYVPMSKEDITKDIFGTRTLDKHWGGMHTGIDYAGDPSRIIKSQHMLRGENGATVMPEGDIYYADRDINGYLWDERFKDKYTRVDNGRYTSTYDPKTNTETRTYFYDPVKAKATDRYYVKKNGKYELVEGDNPYLAIQNMDGYSEAKRVANSLGSQDIYYDLDEPLPKFKELNTDLRYVPAIGLGIASLTDALGLTNKPNYDEANAILEAGRTAGTYQPVKFSPIGNYLTYRPFDRDFYINKMNAEAGATRRSLLNTSGGNRGTAMAGLLAADNNYLNQIGALSRQAEEYKLAQRQQVEDFNRNTNITNSKVQLEADMANQRARMSARELYLNAAAKAAELRQKERLAADAAKSANLSGLVNSLGDIGRENMAWNWRNFGLATGSFGNIGEEEARLLGRIPRQRTSNSSNESSSSNKSKNKSVRRKK